MFREEFPLLFLFAKKLVYEHEALVELDLVRVFGGMVVDALDYLGGFDFQYI